MKERKESGRSRMQKRERVKRERETEGANGDWRGKERQREG